MTQNTKNTKNPETQIWQNWWIHAKIIFKYFQAFLWIPQWKNVIKRPDISHFKAFDMKNLQYEIRVPKKSIEEPQYTTGLGMFFYGTDVTPFPHVGILTLNYLISTF